MNNKKKAARWKKTFGTWISLPHITLVGDASADAGQKSQKHERDDASMAFQLLEEADPGRLRDEHLVQRLELLRILVRGDKRQESRIRRA